MQPVACEEGTEQPREGEAECVEKSTFLDDVVMAPNATADEEEIEGQLEVGGNVHASERVLSPDLVPVVATTCAFALICLAGLATCAWRLARKRLALSHGLDRPRDAAGNTGFINEARLAASMLKQASDILRLTDIREDAAYPIGLGEPPRVAVLVQREGETTFKPAQPRKTRFELRKKGMSEPKRAKSPGGRRAAQ